METEILLPHKLMEHLLVKREDFHQFEDWVSFTRNLTNDPDKIFREMGDHAKYAIEKMSDQLVKEGILEKPVRLLSDKEVEDAKWQIISALMALHLSEDFV